MAKYSSIEDKLCRLARLEEGVSPADTLLEVRSALANKNNVIVSKAAQVAEKCRLGDVVDELVSAFNRLMINPVKRDKLCRAKTSIVSALDGLNYIQGDIFLRGIRHVQMEPAYGEPIDTAVELRAKSALALARIEHPEVFFELVTLLMDRESGARAAAARALAYLGSEKSELILRLKVLSGDEDPYVYGEYFSALMKVAPERSTEFVSCFLSSDNPVIAEDAALCLGESRRPEILKILCEAWKRNDDKTFRRALLLSIALLRSNEAFDFLINIISHDHKQNAISALDALKFCRTDPAIYKKVKEAVKARNDSVMNDTFSKLFNANIQQDDTAIHD